MFIFENLGHDGLTIECECIKFLHTFYENYQELNTRREIKV